MRNLDAPHWTGRPGPRYPNRAPRPELFESEIALPSLGAAKEDFSLQQIADGKLGKVPQEFLQAILVNAETDANVLTNRVFWGVRHPELTGKPLDSRNPRYKALAEEWNQVRRTLVQPLLWLRQIIDQMDRFRGSIPREILLGWMAVESDGQVRAVGRGRRGYFQVDLASSEGRLQIGPVKKQFELLSNNRRYSVEQGVKLVERYRQYVLSNYSSVQDGSELLWHLAKARHAEADALANASNQLAQAGTPITWPALARLLPGATVTNVNRTLQYAAKLKPLADLVPVRSSSQPELEADWPGAQRAMQGEAGWSQEFEGEANLRQAGLKTTSLASYFKPEQLQAALSQSRILGPFIGPNVGKISIAKNYVRYDWSSQFDSAYTKWKKIVAPFDSPASKAPAQVGGFYDRATGVIHLRHTADLGTALTLAIAKFSAPAFYKFFGLDLTVGVEKYFANLVLQEQGLDSVQTRDQKHELDCATNLVGVTSRNMVAKAFFENHSELVNHLTGRLSIGPVDPREVASGALCRTPLLQTARFVNHLGANMISVGITGPRWVRLWMRSDVPGAHEVRISGDSRGERTAGVVIPRGQPGDNTLAVTYPRTSQDQPLSPLTRYHYRVVRKSDGTPLGEGSFETPPARDEDTPQKVVIGLISCHQPFTDQGTIAPDADRMLRLLPRVMKENDVKFVLPCGDQIYSDEPGVFSVFRNPYLIRHAVRGKTNIKDCNADEVRRVFDLRHRMFLSMNPLRKMYANFPCYPALDDHEIKDDWGSDPEHSAAPYRNILQGARMAYYDYQASAVLPPKKPIGSSFHYNFSYGNIGVFVMDIRSERFRKSQSQLFGELQFRDFRQFLKDNSHKKVLLIVASVPVIHLAEWVTNLGAKVAPDVDFPDQWSYKKNTGVRDAFLTALHAHQQANPKQRIAILSGDVHIGNAFVINWRGGSKPRLYQLTSSPVTALLHGIRAKLSGLGPHLVTSIDCNRTKFGESCSGGVNLLGGMTGATSQNPMIGRNIGLIEVQRNGDLSNLKFKLIGYHPTEDRPVTYFESGWLG